ncbi:MAG: hypothetical protein ACI4VJ_03145 [Methanosphaera sp.]|jgi:hypothetical protein|uniref:hypothetical protein n=2 Tax=Methanosphaera TaxID=2316 RepID=UPI003D92D51E
MNIIFSWGIILIIYITLLLINKNLGLTDNFRRYVYNHFNIKLKTQHGVNIIIHVGIVSILFVIPLTFVAWEFVGLMSFGLCLLYLGLGLYFRPHVFSEESVYTEPGEVLKDSTGIQYNRYFSYLDLISVRVIIAVVINAFCMAVQLTLYMNVYPHVIKVFILTIFEFFNITLLIFVDKINNHINIDFRSSKGYPIYRYFAILLQFLPIIICIT